MSKFIKIETLDYQGHKMYEYINKKHIVRFVPVINRLHLIGKIELQLTTDSKRILEKELLND